MNTLITGAGSGIGRASALRMARYGTVVVADRDGAAAAAVAAEIAAAGGRALGLAVDVTRRESVAAMMARVDAEVGAIGGLFNCAGINNRRPVAEITEAAWDEEIGVHVTGTFLVGQAVLRRMCAAGGGAVVNMSSDYAVMGVANFSAYCAAKAAVYSLTKSLALEFAPQGIRVNCLGPGPIDTPLLRKGRTEAEYEAAVARHRERIPMGRLGRPEEVAAVLDFLLSERAGYVTGQIIHPNGGILTW